MTETVANKIGKLRLLIHSELQVLNASFLVAQNGGAILDGIELRCSLDEQVRGCVVLMSLAAGQSVNTVLEGADKRGIAVRDLFPVARCALEAFINAAFVLADGEPVAARAARHAVQRAARDLDQSYGRGALRLRARLQGAAAVGDEMAKQMDEFTSSKGRAKSWTDESIEMRIESVHKAFGAEAASCLLGAYAMIYSDSSEILHGSVAGVQKFYYGDDVEEFRSRTADQVEGLLFACFLAINGFLLAYCARQRFDSVRTMLRGCFDQFMEVVRETKTGAPPLDATGDTSS